jgi:hypothetical protein
MHCLYSESGLLLNPVLWIIPQILLVHYPPTLSSSAPIRRVSSADVLLDDADLRLQGFRGFVGNSRSPSFPASKVRRSSMACRLVYCRIGIGDGLRSP